ncbi:MAG: hypothetical protein GF364_00855 [Candidatus Lokiarchaeota archaeon]|nr:hypothetical protein [Candidatus Lokiarchaeota archaeon]
MGKELSDKITELFNSGMTHQEIGNIVGKPRRTVMRLCNKLGLKRTKSEAAALKIKSPIDKPEIVDFIKENRHSMSLEEIAVKFGSSISSVQRLCNKHDIELDKEKYREEQSKKMIAAWTDEKKAIASEKSRLLVTGELRQKLSLGTKKLWEQDKYRSVQAIKRSEQSWSISSIQSQLYEMLDDLGVKYYREHDDKPNDSETVIGPYNFDCVVPVSEKVLLIECQGDYWHSISKAVIKDEQKKSYINNNFSNYELKYLWEHEFRCRDRVFETLKYWLGITQVEICDFSFCDVNIVQINTKTANKLLDKYHYLSGCGRGGIIYGAFYNGNLIAVCSFSSLIRQNLPYDRKTSRELSRFCVHPKFQKKNFGSWFISRALKKLPINIKTVISYCDTTFNHDGALYKACNFVEDGEVRPDYWYVDENKWVMHKKTLYSHAMKMGVKETEFAEEYGYERVYGSKKIRYIYLR